jgi:hypothetical protein
MLVGGYRMEDHGYAITVSHHESGWSFHLQGDDANQFRDEWEAYEGAFAHFLSDFGYDTLLS